MQNPLQKSFQFIYLFIFFITLQKKRSFECPTSKPATRSFIFLVDKTIKPATQRIILKIVEFLVHWFVTDFLFWSCWVGWNRNQLSLFYTKFLWTKRLLACLASSLDASHACCMGDPNMFQHLDTLKTPFFKVLIIIGLVLLFTPRSFCRLGTLLYFFTVYHSINIRKVSL